jgi:phenol 2-monooxygenase
MTIASVPRGTTIMSNGFITDGHQTRLLPTNIIVDVLVVGAGPVGLLCAYQLAKFSKGDIRVVIIGDYRLRSSSFHQYPSRLERTLTRRDSLPDTDKDDKRDAPVYGRACTLLPRTLELWDQLGVLDEVLNQGVVTKTGFNFEG